MPNTLIHLISEQTMQNLLPILALQPERVIHVRSAGPRFDSAVSKLESAVKVAGVSSDFETHILDSTFPDLLDVQLAMKKILQRYPDAILNFTGGTKLMSVGAFLAASEFGQAILLYCDTEQKQFRALGRNKLPKGLPTFDEVASCLNLPTVLAAHGKPPESWRDDPFNDQLISFGRQAFSIRSQFLQEFKEIGWSRRLRQLVRPDGRIPKSKTKLQEVMNQDILGVFPENAPSCVIDFLEAAVNAGLVDRSSSGFFLTPPKDGINVKSHVEKVANILDGSWIELFLLDLAQRSPLCADPRWSVEPLKSERAPDSRDFGETDVVFLQLPHGNLNVVSCKSDLQHVKPLEHIEALSERSRNLGGRFSRAILYVLDVDNSKREEIERWGRLLNVRILIGEEIFNEFQADTIQ